MHQVLLLATQSLSRLITIWGGSSDTPQDGDEELDVCVLSASLRSIHRSAHEQLRLALAWNRVDLARSLLFDDNQEWQPDDAAINELFFEALIMDRVEFVSLLLERGVNVKEVLTWHRLELLYNMNHADAWLFMDAVKLITGRDSKRCSLHDVGITIETLMGFGYKSPYQRRPNRSLRQRRLSVKIQSALGLSSTESPVEDPDDPERFRYPFSELLIWAVLMRRRSMAQLLCFHGEEMLAKTLIACRLFRSIANHMEADITSEIIVDLKQSADIFAKLAVDLLDNCRNLDEFMSQQLLTYELTNFSNKTCLSLAVSAENIHLVAHISCQNLLDVLWMGGLRVRSTRPWKILLGIACPPFAVYGLNYLSKEELNLQPQTEAEWEEIRLHTDSEADGQNSPITHEDGLAPATPGGGRVTRRFYSFGDATGSFRNKRNQWLANRENVVPPVPEEHYSQRSSNASSNVGASQTIQAERKKRGRVSVMEDFSTMTSQSTPLNPKTRFNEFFNAPVTKFWLHTVSCY